MKIFSQAEILMAQLSCRLGRREHVVIVLLTRLKASSIPTTLLPKPNQDLMKSFVCGVRQLISSTDSPFNVQVVSKQDWLLLGVGRH